MYKRQALISSLILVPNNIPGRASASLRDQMKVLTHPRLLMIYAITALGYGGVFTAFTFLAPMMQELAGFSPSAVSWILLGYGVSVAIGNVWGGKLADKHGAVSALKFIFAALVAVSYTHLDVYKRQGEVPADGAETSRRYQLAATVY